MMKAVMIVGGSVLFAAVLYVVLAAPGLLADTLPVTPQGHLVAGTQP